MDVPVLLSAVRRTRHHHNTHRNTVNFVCIVQYLDDTYGEDKRYFCSFDYNKFRSPYKTKILFCKSRQQCLLVLWSAVVWALVLVAALVGVVYIVRFYNSSYSTHRLIGTQSLEFCKYPMEPLLVVLSLVLSLDDSAAEV
jgi:hypothetical protein